MRRTGLQLAAIVWLGIGLTGLLALTVSAFHWQYLYYFVTVLGVGGPLWRYRRGVTERLRRWSIDPNLKMLALLFGMVLFEEVLAAFFNHMSEGFQLMLFVRRIAQFWAFNLLAFAGAIFASTYLFRRVGYSISDMAVIYGLWGLWAEKVLPTIVGNPPAFVIFAPLVFAVYAIIFVPAFMSVEPPSARRDIAWPLRNALLLAFSFAASLPFMWVLLTLRAKYPGLFPPTAFIS